METVDQLFVENGVSDKPVRVRREAGGSVGLSLVRRRRDGAGSFVVVGENLEVPRRELFPELLGPPQRHVPTDERRASGRKGSSFIFFLGLFGVCVCVVRPRL